MSNTNDKTAEQTLARALQAILQERYPDADTSYTDALAVVNEAIDEQPKVARQVALSRTKLAKLANTPAHIKATRLVGALRSIDDEVHLLSAMRSERQLMIYALGRDDVETVWNGFARERPFTDEMWDEFTSGWLFNHFSDQVGPDAMDAVLDELNRLYED